MALYRYRKQSLCLDSALECAQGSPAAFAEVLRTRLADDAVTGVALARPLLIGQMRHVLGQPAARLAFLLPKQGLQMPALMALLEWLARVAGERGALRVVAEVDERSAAFEGLRRTGFVVYAWQRVWSFSPSGERPEASNLWRPMRSVDEGAVRSLCQLLLPPLALAAETFLLRPGQGLVHCRGDELLAYVSVLSGAQGVYLIPIIHPDVENVEELLRDLLWGQSRGRNRPIYLTMRSYQAWLEPVLAGFQGGVAPRQALMVKHLARLQRAEVTASQAVLEHAWTRNLEARSSTKNGTIG